MYKHRAIQGKPAPRHCMSCGDGLGDSALDLCQWADDPAAWSRMDQRLLREHDAATRMRTAIVRELLDDEAA